MALVECENLVKVFGGGRPVRALDGLNLKVEEGEVFGLLGPNGSGKTTFVKCCMNIIFPTSGHLRVLGRRPGHPRTQKQIGYLPENPSMYDHLTGWSFLYYHSELAGIPLTRRHSRIEEVLKLVHLDPSAARRRLRTYSKGMAQRIGLAQAMLAHPRLIFLDEPQSGLDPIGRRQVKDIMKSAAREGVTVLFSSHVLGDVEDVAERIAIIDKGRVRKIATLDELTLHTNRILIRLRSRKQESKIGEMGDLAQHAIEIANKAGAGSVQFANGVLECTLPGEEDIPRLVATLTSAGLEIFEVKQERMSLEEVFLQEFGELPSSGEEGIEPTQKAS
jgi:ABC-2 type transport system ATP-binding protein